MSSLTIKQLGLDTVHENELIKKEIGTPFEFDKNVNLRLNFSLFS
jgi:hypothetical protein